MVSLYLEIYHKKEMEHFFFSCPFIASIEGLRIRRKKPIYIHYLQSVKWSKFAEFRKRGFEVPAQNIGCLVYARSRKSLPSVPCVGLANGFYVY